MSNLQSHGFQPAAPSRRSLFRYLVAWTLLLLLAAKPAAADSLKEAGFAVSSGAAPGYLADRTCRNCHGEIFQSYRQVGMARSFFRPRPENLIEDFGAPPFFHPASRQFLHIVRRDERLFFRRWQVDSAGRERNLLELEIDWILGSGNHSRTYLYRQADGSLFQLPLAWYAANPVEKAGFWAMAPGYDRPDHEGVLRRVRRECLFCHNAYPEVAHGSDAENAPHFFPPELPEGIGCQRCHGPGAEHVRRAFDGAERSAVSAAIVNPAKLAPDLRKDVCRQCHLQPAVSLAGARRLGRETYSFRPGEALTSYQAHVDVDEEGSTRSERFEINHHPYRLEQSRCFLASKGELSCLTCHDPHEKVAPVERIAHFRAACVGCHSDPAACKRSDAPATIAAEDCTACHMPKRRPRDVVHVVMTDHLIQKPQGFDLLAPRAESEPILVGVELLDSQAIPAAERELYRALPLARTGTSGAAYERLRSLLVSGGHDPRWRIELAIAALRRQQPLRALELVTETPMPIAGRRLEILGLAEAGRGRLDDAERHLRAALAEPDAEKAEVMTRLAGLLASQGRNEEARRLFSAAVELRPNLVAAWLGLAQSLQALGRIDESAPARARAVALHPPLP